MHLGLGRPVDCGLEPCVLHFVYLHIAQFVCHLNFDLELMCGCGCICNVQVG